MKPQTLSSILETHMLRHARMHTEWKFVTQKIEMKKKEKLNSTETQTRFLTAQVIITTVICTPAETRLLGLALVLSIVSAVSALSLNFCIENIFYALDVISAEKILQSRMISNIKIFYKSISSFKNVKYNQSQKHNS